MYLKLVKDVGYLMLAKDHILREVHHTRLIMTIREPILSKKEPVLRRNNSNIYIYIDRETDLNLSNEKSQSYNLDAIRAA